MKKIFSRTYMKQWILLFVLVMAAVFAAGWYVKEMKADKEQPSQQDQNVVTETDTELLLSFESYEEITGTGLKFGNQFGKTSINQDKQYVTEGDGSWRVEPQGDYGKESAFPYFGMYFDVSTMRHNDFNPYDSILMDIYNDSDEEIEIEWYFKTMTLVDEVTASEKTVCTLAPHAWTSISYDLTDDTYSSFYRLSGIEYMNVTILSKKDSKDDKTPTLYFDNLRGHLMDGERIIDEITVDYTEGVTFENESDKWFVYGSSDKALPLSRVKYTDTTIGKQKNSFGEYGLMGDATGSQWPTFTAYFGEKFHRGQELTFMMYVEADENLVQGKRFIVESQTDTVNSRRLRFNTWVEVSITLKTDATRVSMFVNIAKDSLKADLTGSNVKIYVDNFRISGERKALNYDFSKGVTFENTSEEYLFVDSNDVKNSITLSLAKYEETSIGKQAAEFGSYCLRGDATGSQWPIMTVNLGKQYSAGSLLNFKIYVEADATLVGDNTYKIESPNNSIYNARFAFNKWADVCVMLGKDTSSVRIMLNIAKDATSVDFGNKEVIAYFDNFYMYPGYDLTKGFTLEEEIQKHYFAGSNSGNKSFPLSYVKYAETALGAQNDTFGEYGLMGDATGSKFPTVTMNFGKAYKKGQEVTFMLYVDADENMVSSQRFIVEALGHTVNCQWLRFNKWVKVSITLGKNCSSLSAFVNLDRIGVDLADAKVKVYMDNFCISGERKAENYDYSKGVTFETASEQYLFKEVADKKNALTLSWLNYNKASIGKQDANFGTYCLSGDATGSQWPMFTVNLGKTYSAGSVLNFKVYVEADAALVGNNTYKVESPNNSIYNARFIFNKWADVCIVLGKDTSSVRVMLNIAKDATSIDFGNEEVIAYMDNFYIYPAVELTQGFDLENAIQKHYFVGANSGNKSLPLSHVKYAKTPLGVQKDTFGEYGLMGNATGSKFPTFTVNFGNTYKAGQELTFMLYVGADENLVSSERFLVESSGNTVNSQWLRFNQWVKVSITLGKDSSSLSAFVNLDRIGIDLADADVKIYLDNFYISGERKAENYDYSKGVTFEKASEQYLFKEVADKKNALTLTLANYEETSLGKQTADMGSYCLQGDATGSKWPMFTVDFGKTYSKGAVLSFMLYVEATEGIEEGATYKVECSGHSLKTWSFGFNQWVEVEILLDKDATSATIMINVEGAQGINHGKTEVITYIDNFMIDESDYDLSKGVGFETPKDSYYFGGDKMSIARVKYADTTIGKQGKEYGNYGVAGTGLTTKWPYLAIKFGDDKYTQGSTLTYKMYVDTGDTKPENVTGKIEAKETSKYTMVTSSYELNQWVDVEVTIKAAASRVDLMLNVEKLVNAGIALDDITIYFDNFKIHTYNIGEGVTFEKPCDKNFIASSNNTLMTRSIVAYKDTAIGNQSEEFGNYGQMGTVKDASPRWSVKFNDTYTAGKTLRFKAYVAAPSQYEGKQWKMETPTNCSLPTSMFAFNQWVDVEVVLGADVSGLTLIMNFKKATTGVDFTSSAIQVYVDNFVIVD